MPNSEIHHLCRVCGLYHEQAPWGDDGKTPTFNICECCGVEFGYEDSTIQATAMFRKNWMTHGAPWFNSMKKPLNWSLSQQLSRIGVTEEE